jgi:flagellar export protein FliJ
MKKFEFRLAAALKARNVALDAAKTELAGVAARHDLAVGLLETRRQDLLNIAATDRAPGSMLDAHQELLRQRHQHQVREEINRRKHIVVKLVEELDKAREAVTAAYREVRALEVLEERDREVWVQETLREEQKENDDHNSQRHGRS